MIAIIPAYAGYQSMDSTIIAALIGATASIVVACITVSRTRGGHMWPQGGTENGPTTPFNSNPNPPANEIARFTVHGEVIRTVGKDLGIRVENERALRDFWQNHRIDTDINWFGAGPPVVSIGRSGDVARCKLGDRVDLTFVVVDRAAGKRGIRTVDFSNHSVEA